MIGLNQLLAVMLIVHVALFGSTIFLQNSSSDTAYYGGPHGFLPSSGDSASAYDRFSSWLVGDSRAQLDDPGETGGLAILQWIVRTPLCGTVGAVKTLISVTILKYGLVDSIPNEGFGMWVKVVIHLIATFIHSAGLNMLVRFAIQAGVFSNVYIMGAIGLISAFGIVATLLNAGGAFSCG